MRWLLRFLVGDADRRAIESDLAELHEWHRRQRGGRAADRWLRRQRLLYPVHVIADRLRAALPGWTTMQQLWRDARYSLRSLARQPVLAATIVLTVGVGLGATTAMLAVVRAVLVNPLPYEDAEHLFWIYTDNPPYQFRFSVVDYRALEADHPAFSHVAAYQTSVVTVSDGDQAERVTARAVTGSYFGLLGQQPHIGRLFDASDDGRGEPIGVLTHGHWTSRFGSDPSVLGRSMTVNGARVTIVGVLERVTGPFEQNTALFTVANWPAPTRRGPFFTMALGRLAPGVTREAALASLHATNRRLFPIWQSSYQDEKATWGIQDLKARVLGGVGPTLLAVLAAVACVLLVACANAANLLIARSVQRSRELAIRGALGASRHRLLQLVLVEAGVLGAGAALLGLAVAGASVKMVTVYGANYIPRLGEVGLSGGALLWMAGLALVAGLLVGLVPAWYGTRLRVDAALRSDGRASTAGPAARRVRRALVAAEFALATPLLVAAVLVIASLDRLARVPVGVDTSRVLSASVSLPGARYADGDARAAFWARLLDAAAALPGVESAAMADSLPPQQSGNQNNFDLEDRPTPAGQNQPICTWVAASPAFFDTVGLTLEEGRPLDARSAEENLIVVDRAWANRFFPGERVVGRRLHEGGCTECPWTTVIGVVGNVRWHGLDAVEDGTVYWPFVSSANGFVVLRTPVDPGSLTEPLRRTVRDLDAGLALADVATGDELVDQALATPRYLSVVIGLFGAAALVLSIVGIYGVMASFVQQHTRDIGIRLALGGEPARVRRLVVLEGMRLVVAGVVIGLAGTLAAGRLLASLLFDVSPRDPATLVAVPAALAAVAIVACLVPAHRAARVDPAVVLRES